MRRGPQYFPRCNRQHQPDTDMKILPTLTVTAFMTAGSAFAATTQAPTATPAAATPVEKHNSTSHCEKEAKAKKLKGDEEKQFVKDARKASRPDLRSPLLRPA